MRGIETVCVMVVMLEDNLVLKWVGFRSTVHAFAYEQYIMRQHVIPKNLGKINVEMGRVSITVHAFVYVLFSI